MDESKRSAGKPRRTKAAAGAAAGAKPGGKAAVSSGGNVVKPKARAKPVQRAPAKVVTAPGPSPAEREQRVRIAAYLRAERRGFEPGYAVEDWLAAEAEVSLGLPEAQRPKTKGGKPRSG